MGNKGQGYQMHRLSSEQFKGTEKRDRKHRFFGVRGSSIERKKEKYSCIHNGYLLCDRVRREGWSLLHCLVVSCGFLLSISFTVRAMQYSTIKIEKKGKVNQNKSPKSVTLLLHRHTINGSLCSISKNRELLKGDRRN